MAYHGKFRQSNAPAAGRRRTADCKREDRLLQSHRHLGERHVDRGGRARRRPTELLQHRLFGELRDRRHVFGPVIRIDPGGCLQRLHGFCVLLHRLVAAAQQHPAFKVFGRFLQLAPQVAG